MRRKSFDTLTSAAALGAAAVLLSASSLLFWAHPFISDNVRTQLSAQQVLLPPAESKALDDPGVKPYLAQYAGQTLRGLLPARRTAYDVALHLSGWHPQSTPAV